MNPDVLPPVDREYPESDGKPMGENTWQVRAIMALYSGLSAHFEPRDDVFVAADLFWYPVEGRPKVVHAPDVMLAFGRPPGDRRSYKQWEEGGTAPQVVIEVLSPSDKPKVRARKLAFYDRHGVEEFVEYDPDREVMRVWTRQAGALTPTQRAGTFDSPRLGLRLFCPAGGPLRVYRPDGTALRTYQELVNDNEMAQLRMAADRRRATQARRDATQARRQAAAERWTADAAQQRADAAQQRADAEQARAEAERQAAAAATARADALAARLRSLGHDPDA